MITFKGANLVGITSRMADALVNGRYALMRKLAQGASATVYEARDEGRAGAPRALKVLSAPDSLAGRTPPARERALAWEFARLSRIDHPHIVRAHDLDVVRQGPLPEGSTFLVEELVDGSTCEHAFGPLSPGDRVHAVIRLLAECASALGRLH